MATPQNNIQVGAEAPLQGEWTGVQKPVKLNHRYTGGKLADMPMYNKSSDIDPIVNLKRKSTQISNKTRFS